MSLFKTTTSYATVIYESIDSMEDMLEHLKTLPVKNIIGTTDLSTRGYQAFPDVSAGEFLATDDFLYINEVAQEKKLPKKKINQLVEIERELHYSEYSKKDFKEEMYDDVFHRFALLEAPKCSVQTSVTDILIDTKNKTIYINLKGNTKLTYTVYKLQENLGVVNPRIQSNISMDMLRAWPSLKASLSNELFLFWIYKKATSEQIGDLGVKMNMKVGDYDSQVAVKGKLSRFEDIFTRLESGRGIKEMSLSLPTPLVEGEEQTDMFSFTIVISANGVKNFRYHLNKYSYPCLSELGSRADNFKKLNLLLKRLFTKFEKDILNVGIDKYYAELRGLKEDEA
jgi:DNA recombination-dependent growth factor C